MVLFWLNKIYNHQIAGRHNSRFVARPHRQLLANFSLCCWWPYAQFIIHLALLNQTSDWWLFKTTRFDWSQCCFGFDKAGGRISGDPVRINNELISKQYSSLRLGEENWYEFARTNKTIRRRVVNKTPRNLRWIYTMFGKLSLSIILPYGWRIRCKWSLDAKNS